MFFRSFLIICSAALAVDAAVAPAISPAALSRARNELPGVKAREIQGQHETLRAEARQDSDVEERQMIIPADLYSVEDWANSLDFWALLLRRNLLPIIMDLMSASVGRQSDFMRPVLEVLPQVARFFNTASLIMTSFTGFLRDTIAALNTDFPVMNSNETSDVEVTVAELARRLLS